MLLSNTELEARIKDAWGSLLNKDDRNSPHDYPEMCLITREELGEYMADAAFVEPPVKMTDQLLVEAWKKCGGAISDDGRAAAWEAKLAHILRGVVSSFRPDRYIVEQGPLGSWHVIDMEPTRKHRNHWQTEDDARGEAAILNSTS